MQLSAFERQESISRYIAQNERISITEVCREFDVSMATARRDLEALAERGKVQRVHGGAIAVRNAPPELPVAQRMTTLADEKQRIGKLAAQLVHDGDTVFLGSGTTVLEVARNLTHLQNLTVITNSLLVINQLAMHASITVLGVGGMLRRSELSFIGHIAEQALSEVRADKIILGVRAVSATHGLMNDYLPETMTDRTILGIGREVIVVADHSKCNCVSVALLAPLKVLGTLVTDKDAPTDFIDSLTEQGIRVLVA